MKSRLLIFLTVTFNCSLCFAQTITPKQFLSLFSNANDDKAVELIDAQLESYSNKWKIIGGNKDESNIYVKWYHPSYELYDAEFYLYSEKTKDRKVINKIIYSFSNKQLFSSYLSSIKGLTGIKLVNSEKLADGSTRLVYESQGVAFFLGTHPTVLPEYNNLGIYTTYSVSMFYH